MGFLDKIKGAAKSAAEKATTALKDSGVLVTGFEPLPEEIKDLPMGGRLLKAPFLEELMQNRKPDTTFGVCLTDTKLYVVEHGRLWRTYNIEFGGENHVEFFIEDIQKNETDSRVSVAFTFKLKIGEEELIFSDYFSANKDSERVNPLLSAQFARLESIFRCKTYMMCSALNEVTGDKALSEADDLFFKMANALIDNGFTWKEEIMNEILPEED